MDTETENKKHYSFTFVYLKNFLKFILFWAAVMHNNWTKMVVLVQRYKNAAQWWLCPGGVDFQCRYMEVWGSERDTQWTKLRTPALNHEQSFICLCFNPSGSVRTTWFSPFMIRDCWKNLCKTNHKSHILSASPGCTLIFHRNRGNPICKSVFATIADVALSFSPLHSLFLRDDHERRKGTEIQWREFCGGVSWWAASTCLAERNAHVEMDSQHSGLAAIKRSCIYHRRIHCHT